VVSWLSAGDEDSEEDGDAEEMMATMARMSASSSLPAANGSCVAAGGAAEWCDCDDEKMPAVVRAASSSWKKVDEEPPLSMERERLEESDDDEYTGCCWCIGWLPSSSAKKLAVSMPSTAFSVAEPPAERSMPATPKHAVSSPPARKLVAQLHTSHHKNNVNRSSETKQLQH
jgi:hypothetical protein